MSHVISYSLFNDCRWPFEFGFYLRGIYLNARMNALIYPEWETWLFVSSPVYKKYEDFLTSLPISFIHITSESPRCEAMLHRMLPAFHAGVDHLICRDSDAITTYREACSVHRWLKSGKSAHMILDNPAHGGMMGGMVGFKTEKIRQRFSSFESLIEGFDLSWHGSDQHLLNMRIYPYIKDDVYLDKDPIKHPVDLPGVDKKYWESDLTCRFIGAPGACDMELLRFFKRHDPNNYDDFEKEFRHILYWAQ